MHGKIVKRAVLSFLALATAVLSDLYTGRATTTVPEVYEFGYIDRRGNVIVPPSCDRASVVSDNGWVGVEQGNRRGFINLVSRRSTGLLFDGDAAYLPPPLFAFGIEPVSRDHKYGYIDDRGIERIPFRFEQAGRFGKAGLAAVKLDGAMGYIDRRGRISIPAQYEFASAFDSRGYARVKIRGKWGAVDRHGKLIIAADYEGLGLPETGDLAIATKDGRMGVIGLDGRPRTGFTFGVIYPFVKNGLAPASTDAKALVSKYPNGKWGFINASGQFVIPPVFTDVTAFEGKRPPSYTRSARAPEGLAAARIRDATGQETSVFINARGAVIWRAPAGVTVSAVYANGQYTVFDSRKDPAQPWLLGRSGLLDSKRPEAPIRYLDLIGDYKFGLAPAIKGGKWGYIGASGEFAILPQFASASDFDSDGLANVLVAHGPGDRPTVSFIDRTGRIVLATPFHGTSGFGNHNYAQVWTTRIAFDAQSRDSSKCALRSTSGIASQ